MRITSTTSVPVRAKETTAAGPAEAMTTPLPTNRPAPITPPSAIMCMCRRCSARRSPLEAESGAVIGAAAAGSCTRAASHEFLVFRQVPYRLRQGVTPERVTELLRHHHFQHGRLAGALRRGRGAQCGPHIGEPLEGEAIAAERARHGGPAGVLQIDPLVAPRVEVDVVLLLRAPLLIVEDDHRHADALARARQQLVEADAPRAVAHGRERRTLGSGEHRGTGHRD